MYLIIILVSPLLRRDSSCFRSEDMISRCLIVRSDEKRKSLKSVDKRSFDCARNTLKTLVVSKRVILIGRGRVEGLPRRKNLMGLKLIPISVKINLMRSSSDVWLWVLFEFSGKLNKIIFWALDCLSTNSLIKSISDIREFEVEFFSISIILFSRFETLVFKAVFSADKLFGKLNHQNI